MKLTQKQIESVVALPAPKRYSHFIKMAADQNRVWGLFSDGWALAATSTGQDVFPLWPAAEYAQLCAAGDWAGYSPREIPLDELFQQLLPRLRDTSTPLAVFYTPRDQGVIPNLEEFEADLKTELDRIE
jgi:hypothetical protein